MANKQTKHDARGVTHLVTVVIPLCISYIKGYNQVFMVQSRERTTIFSKNNIYIVVFLGKGKKEKETKIRSIKILNLTDNINFHHAINKTCSKIK